MRGTGEMHRNSKHMQTSKMAAAARTKVLHLYRQILRESSKFSSYNYREYAIRKTRDAFKVNKNVQDSVNISELIQQAEKNLDIIKRQALLSNMYSHDKLVIEKQ